MDINNANLEIAKLKEENEKLITKRIRLEKEREL